MANYPTISQSPKSNWNEVSKQINVIGPNGKPYVADDGRNYDVLHYDVTLVHPPLNDADKELIENFYIANKLLRFLIVSDEDGKTFNCMFKKPPNIIKDTNEHWIVSTNFLASSTNLT